MKNFYLLYGENRDILNREINEIKNKLNVTENDITYYEIEDITQIVNEAQTVNMFSNVKLLIINSTNYLSNKKEIDNIDLLLDYINNFNSDSYLLFTSNSESIDSRKKLVKLIGAKGIVKKIEINNEYLINYVINYLGDRGYDFNNTLATYLINRCGNNIDNLTNELDKLILYKMDNKVITIDDINLLTGENIDDSVFDLVNAIIKRNFNKGIKLYNSLIQSGIDVSQIIGLLASQFRLLYQVKRLYNEGKSNDEIAKILEFKNVYRVKYLLGDSYEYTESELLQYLSLLAELDRKIKFGLIDGNVGLELFITRKDM